MSINAKLTARMERRAALELKLRSEKAGELVFRRGNEILGLGTGINRWELFLMCREFFSMCGERRATFQLQDGPEAHVTTRD